MRILDRICCILLLFLATKASAQNYSNLELVENKGQWPAQVKFRATTNTGAFYLQPDGYKMVLHDPNDLLRVSQSFHGHSDNNTEGDAHKAAAKGGERIVVHSHAYEMKFLYANREAAIVPDKALSSYNNYFIGDDPSKWASNCHIYQGITYRDVYPGVDVRYYTDNGQLKYDLIVNPGASIDKIAMHFDGVDHLTTADERLVIKTSVQYVQELKPYTYQPMSSGRKEVSNRFEVDGNIVRFKIGNYDKTKVLVIDPTLVFSTFSGSTADNWGYTATYDNDGNFYGGGIVFGIGFPVSTGAFQTTFQGGASESGTSGYDIGIIKFNPTGTNRIYATYIGGSANEQPHSLVADAQGNLYIAGRTNSANYPGTLTGPGGGWDIVLTKLNNTGTALIGSRRIGGTVDDGVNIRPKSTPGVITINRNYGDDARSEVLLDGAGNVYVASCSQSFDFPTTPGVFQPTKKSLQDGVIIKATSDLSSITFATYLGGGGEDAAFVLAINPITGVIYTAGATTSTDFPGTGNGPVLSASNNGGETDGFVAMISSNGTALLKSTYVGTTNADMVYGVQLDNNNFPYIMGTTAGDAVWPTTSNVTYKIPGGKEFICKLQPDLSAFVYSTTFGKTVQPLSSPDISPVAFLVDRCENVYVSGWGGGINTGEGWPNSGTNQLPTAGLPSNCQNQTLRCNTDNSDFYIFVMERNARSILFGAFFGAMNATVGDHVDGGTSRFDKNGVIYQAACGYCYGGGTPFPTTPGAWAQTRGSSACNLAAVKIAMNLAGIATGVKSFVNGTPRRMGCIPLTVDFRDTLAMGQQYIWNFGDGSPDETTTSANNSHTYQNIGTYTVRLVSIDSSTCNIVDTSYTTINVRQDNAKLNGYIAKLPPCEGLAYRFYNTSTPPAAPGKPFTSTSFQWIFGDGQSVIAGTAPVDHTYPAKGTYNVKLVLVDTNYCNYPDTFNITLRIADNVKAGFTTPPSGCAPYTPVITNTSIGGASYQWTFGDGGTSNAATPTYTYTTPGTYTIRLTAIDTNTCNKMDSIAYTIVVSGSPTAAFDFSPKPPQVNTAVSFANLSSGAIGYLWRFGDGDTLATTRRDTTIQHFYNATQTFNTCLEAYNQYGCRDTACLPVAARVEPALDVPNAFTPNGDGVNDQVHVRGFGIAKMNWRIYNRWGQLIFMTTNRNEGWDGRFKGVLQPQEVYTYSLDVEFSDGTKTTKTGDITLLR